LSGQRLEHGGKLGSKAENQNAKLQAEGRNPGRFLVFNGLFVAILTAVTHST
jgi:hypothetical protein